MSKSNFFFRVARIKRPRKPPFLLCCKVSDISMYSWILKHHPGFADCLWRGNLIFIYCDLLRQPNKYIFKLLSFKRRQYTSVLQCTVGDGSTGGVWIQEFHDFAKSQITVKLIKSLPQIIRSWIYKGSENHIFLIVKFIRLEKKFVIWIGF